MQDQDDRRMWQAINWKGLLQNDDKAYVTPSDADFKDIYESVMNPTINEDFSLSSPDVHVNIPILDDPISADEVVEQINKIKPDKACGPDGVSLDVFKILPQHWILMITTFFNSIFISGSYPDAWTRAIFFTIFKRGDRNETMNYRGISIINSLAKLYGMVLCCRLERWFIPYLEQAGV